jgi:hydrogenase 3 maturation protease
LTKGEYNLEKVLKEWLAKHGKIAVAGIGNPIRMDDFVGVKIVPESFMDEIVQLKPSHVLLIDAAVMELKPGEVRLFDVEKVTSFPAISTHMLPLRVFCEYITQLTGAKIALLLVQPGDTEFGEGLTTEVQEAAEMVTGILLECFGAERS